MKVLAGRQPRRAGIPRGCREAGLAAALSAALALGACRPSETASSVEESTQVMTGVRMVETQSGRRVWQIEASSATVAEAAEIVDLERPDLSIEKKGEDSTRITAEKGRYDTKSRDLVFSGDVVAYSKKEDTHLYSPTLTYASGKDRVYTRDAVRIENEDGTVRGRNLTAKSDLSEMTLERNEGVVK